MCKGKWVVMGKILNWETIWSVDTSPIHVPIGNVVINITGLYLLQTQGSFSLTNLFKTVVTLWSIGIFYSFRLKHHYTQKGFYIILIFRFTSRETYHMMVNIFPRLYKYKNV